MNGKNLDMLMRSILLGESFKLSYPMDKAAVVAAIQGSELGRARWDLVEQGYARNYHHPPRWKVLSVGWIYDHVLKADVVVEMAPNVYYAADFTLNAEEAANKAKQIKRLRPVTKDCGITRHCVLVLHEHIFKDGWQMLSPSEQAAVGELVSEAFYELSEQGSDDEVPIFVINPNFDDLYVEWD